MKRILVIRGGAIGDFILTLPTLKALRDAYPHAHIEILGYKNITALAERRFYAQAIRSIEYGPLASFFAKNSELSADLADYFAGFDLIISYLYDPDGIFEMNLRRCGVENLIHGPAKVDNGAAGRRATWTPARSVDELGGESINQKHAAEQLARPIREIEAAISDFAAKLYPSSEDRQVAAKFLGDDAGTIIAFHPGSGSEKKNWPLENWIDLGNHLLSQKDFDGSIMIVCGEADKDQVARLESIWANRRVRFANGLPLPHLAALLENAIFVGHDSGISHLAAAAGANCILLFGPTDPEVWGPRNENVRVIRAPEGDLRQLDLDPVRNALDHAVMRIGISTYRNGV
jgi:heptosyltransferase-3